MPPPPSEPPLHPHSSHPLHPTPPPPHRHPSESYTFNPGLGHPHNLCLLIWSQCQAEPSQHKPSFQMQCEEAQKFAVPEAYPEAAVAGKSFDAGEKRCCRSAAANGLPCNSGIDSWMGISYEALENIGAALVVAACFCLCCIKMYVACARGGGGREQLGWVWVCAAAAADAASDASAGAS